MKQNRIITKKTRPTTKSLKKKKLSAADKQNIRIFADMLGKLIPLSGYRSSFTLKTVAKENKLLKYLPSKTVNKKESISVFVENIIYYKPRTLKKLIREILPKAIEKRHRDGNPVLEEEANQFSLQLYKLNVDLLKEIKELQLPRDRPKIVPPPIEIQKILDNFSMHPQLLPDCKEMFNQGHLNESVRKALERFEKTVQTLSGLIDKNGYDLMSDAFNENNPKILLNALTTKQERNEQIGFKFIAMGIMQGWRNNLSHGDEPQMPHHEALGRLIAISNLFSRLDERVVI